MIRRMYLWAKWAVVGLVLSVCTCCGTGEDATRALAATRAVIVSACHEPLPPDGAVTREQCDAAVAGWNTLNAVHGAVQ